MVGHLGWTRLFPTERLISSAPLDRKDATNWEGWRREYEARGLALHTVVDIGEVLVRNLAGSSVFVDVEKYYVIGDTDVCIEGATGITALDQTRAYRQAVGGPRNRKGR